ncbi:hypothetical protein ALC56_12509, partial [Trachymyrmex septentrionalis]
VVNRTIRFLVRKEAVSCRRGTLYPRLTVLNSERTGRGRNTQRGEERSLNFPTSSLTCRVLILKFVVCRPGTERARALLGTGTRNRERCLPRLVH